MNSFREQYISALTNRACQIMSKSELTQQDIDFLMLFKSELKHLDYVPKIKRIINGANDILSFVKKTLGTLNKDDTQTDTEEEITANNQVEETNNDTV